MKVILVNERYGQTRTIVLKGWLKGLISVCLLGAPVALGYLGFQVAVAFDGQAYSHEVQHWQIGQRDAQVGVDTAADAGNADFYRKTYPAAHPTLEDIELLARRDQALARLLNGLPAGSHLYRLSYRHGRLIDPATYSHRTAG